MAAMFDHSLLSLPVLTSRAPPQRTQTPVEAQGASNRGEAGAQTCSPNCNGEQTVSAGQGAQSQTRVNPRPRRSAGRYHSQCPWAWPRRTRRKEPSHWRRGPPRLRARGGEGVRCGGARRRQRRARRHPGRHLVSNPLLQPRSAADRAMQVTGLRSRASPAATRTARCCFSARCCWTAGRADRAAGRLATDLLKAREAGATPALRCTACIAEFVSQAYHTKSHTGLGPCTNKAWN